jgi:hypothetical protein
MSHNDVGVSTGGGDQPLLQLTEEAFDRVCAINLRGTIMACKQVIPVMRAQHAGAIVNISSTAARELSVCRLNGDRGGADCLTWQLAIENAAYSIRQRHPAGADRHADGGRYAGPRRQPPPRRARCAGAAAEPHRHRLGCRQRRPLSCLG